MSERQSESKDKTFLTWSTQWIMISFPKIWNTLEGEKKINTDFIHVDFEVTEISKWKLSNRQLTGMSEIWKNDLR